MREEVEKRPEVILLPKFINGAVVSHLTWTEHPDCIGFSQHQIV